LFINNSEAIELLKTLPLKLFILKIIKKFIKLLFLCIKINYLLIFLTLITFLQDNGLLEKIGGIKVLIELLSQIPNLVYLEEYFN
jgi:replicative DNA helicase